MLRHFGFIFIIYTAYFICLSVIYLATITDSHLDCTASNGRMISE
jgi:hypothetical protein